MAKKELVVPQAPRMKGVAPPASVPFDTKIRTSTGARESIQWHAVAARYFFIPLAEEHLDAGYTFAFPPSDGPKVVLRRSITVGEMRDAYARSVALTNPELAKIKVIEASRKPGDTIRDSFAYLSSTSKMGCWSFNLLAGPPDLGGACPAATPGFMFTPEEKQRQARKMLRVVPESVRTEDYLCSGCYALKGKYGDPKVILSHTLRHRLMLRLLREGTFVDETIRAIRHGQAVSRRERAKTPQSLWWATKHPDYFRIHDAGDFYEDTYARAWIEIMRRLPDIHFWAPTRMFALKGGAATTFKKVGVPSNLALRPSGLHFGESSPPVVWPGTPRSTVYGEPFPGVAAGSGARKTDSRTHLPIEPLQPGEWMCPATIHWTAGGGAQVPEKVKFDKSIGKQRPRLVRHPYDPLPGETPEQLKAKKKYRQKQPPAYTCGLAHGPNSPHFGGNNPDESPEGGGCRVCWRYKGVAVYYGEH